MARRALVVCTANVCRSPVAERLLRRELDEMVDADGQRWTVSSAGIAEVTVGVDRSTVRAAAAIGVDLRDHRRRTLDGEILRADGADLVLTMTREHLRWITDLDPTTWPRSFTLLQLARHAGSAPHEAGESFETWLRRMANGRRAAEMVRSDPADDVADPFGGPSGGYRQMVELVATAISSVVGNGPWRPGERLTAQPRSV